MIWIVLLLVGWLAFAQFSYKLFETDWLRRFDLKRGDRRFLIGMSLLGPASLLAAVLVWLGGRPQSVNSDEVLKRKQP